MKVNAKKAGKWGAMGVALAIFLIYLLISSLMPGKILHGRVVNVADGDTFTLLDSSGNKRKIRLYGIDAPEWKQAYGRKARNALAAMLEGQDAEVKVIDEDRYGRQVGVVTVNHTNINREMLAGGHAWYYGHFCRQSFCGEWAALEKQARREKLGLWKRKPIAPWIWRRSNK